MAEDAKICLGSPRGSFREGFIDKDNADGTVDIVLSEGNGLKLRGVPYSSTWYGPDGQFMGGAPIIKSTVIVSQNAAGEWYIVSHIKSDSSLESFITDTNTLMSSLRNGRALIQVKDGNKIIVDPSDGIHIGNEENELHIDPNNRIFSHNFEQELRFTEASRSVNGVIKRDLGINSSRGVLGTLSSHLFDRSLFTIGIDPTANTSPATDGNVVRNPALVEHRDIFYETRLSDDFTDDSDESARYLDPNSGQPQPRVNRKRSRADTLSLNDSYPNHLYEKIIGTSVDAFGNILDLNRDILPIGKVKELSLVESEDKQNAFKRIRELLRKSVAYHMELNTRKPLEKQGPPKDKVVDYGRDNSNLSIAFDKEGQFKINVPASSEKGNIPLHVRYDNFSNLLARTDDEIHPNSYVRANNNKEIYLMSFANDGYITLKGDKTLAGFEAPIDRLTGKQIGYGTVHHNITTMCKFLTTESPRLPDTKQVHPYIHDDNKLNNEEHFAPYDPIVSREITVYGDNADAGGRSGSINLDGFISLNMGANTIDRQSMWMDCAGGIVSCIGRDKQNISHAAQFDGHVIWQIGGSTIGNKVDSRFATSNDANIDGVLDIRVIVNNGQQLILRLSNKGIDIFSPAAINITSQQNINIRANGNLNLEGTAIQLHAGSSKRLVQKYPNNSI